MNEGKFVEETTSRGREFQGSIEREINENLLELRLAQCERMAAGDRISTKSEEQGRVKEDLMMKDAVNSAKINLDTPVRKR